MYVRAINPAVGGSFVFFKRRDRVIFEKFSMVDFVQLAAMEQQYKRAIGEAEMDNAQLSNLRTAIEKEQITFFVGKEQGQIVAMCSISLAFSTFSCQPNGIFEDFYVAEAYRKKGVARSLLRFVFATMEAQGIASLWVGSGDVDVDMYKSLGFAMPLGNLLAWHAAQAVS